jgi:hypothetical protein
MRKKILFLVLSLFMGITCSNAGNKRITKAQDTCDTSPGPLAFSYSKDVGLKCPSYFYANGEFLMLRASEQGLDYAIAVATSYYESAVNASIKGFSSDSKDWDWNPGFRACFGGYLTFDDWNPEIKYTYMRIKDDTAINTKQNLFSFFLDINELDVAEPYAYAGGERWSGHHHVLDFTLGKPFHVSKFVIFNPFFGLRSAFIDQNMTFRLSYPRTNLPSLKPQANNDYWGVGLHGGIKSEFFLGKNWNLFANFSGSLLYGHFDVKQQSRLNTTTTSTRGYNFTQDFYIDTTNVESTVGLAWGCLFNNDNNYINLSIAYEFQRWGDQNQLKRFISGDIDGLVGTLNQTDLMYNGVSFKLQFDF